MQNAAARLIFRARWYDHVQPLLRSLHWLRVPEQISFQLAVLVYRCLHDSAPGYMASDLQRASDLGACRRLRSSSTSALVAPRTVRATIGDRAFPAAAASVWNSLPETVRSPPSLPVFRRRLNFLSGLTAVLPHERLTVLTTMWPHITVTCPCSPRTLCHVKSIRYHHHQHHPEINRSENCRTCGGICRSRDLAWTCGRVCWSTTTRLERKSIAAISCL